MKKCKKCNLEKPLEDFCKNKASKDGRYHLCKKCKRKIDKSYYDKNPEYFAKYRKKYYNENREELIKKSIITNKKYRKNNPLYVEAERKRAITRKRLNTIIQGGSFDYCDILCCDSETFKKHLESKFRKGESFENRHEWEIDHIIPYKKAKTKNDILRLSHYKNIQILTPSENKLKNLYNLS